MNPQKIKILVLTANPTDTSIAPLGLDREVRQIEAALQRSRNRDRFQLITRAAVRPTDLRRELLDHCPQIVHFSGYGAGDRGLILETDAGTMQPVSTESLARLFNLFNTGEIECVVLNACYSEGQAEAIHQSIDCVIGMHQPLSDQAAIQFSEGFYDALGAGSDYDEAYRIGCSAIDLAGSSDYLTPKLKIRKRRPAASPEPALAPISPIAPPVSSQSIGNITISGNNNPFSNIQSSGNVTLSQTGSSQSIHTGGGNISGQIGQAGGDLTQRQTESQTPLTADRVISLLDQIESLLRQSSLPDRQKNQALAHLQSAKEEAEAQEPDQMFAAKSLQKTSKILKEANETVEAGKGIWNTVAPILQKLLPWLGVASQFLSL